MKRILSLKMAVATLTAVVLLGGVASGFELIPIGPAVSFSLLGIATSSTDWDTGPSLDGKLMAWTHYEGPDHTTPGKTGIGVRNIATGETRWIGVGDGFNQAYPDVSGDRVVYQDRTSGNYDIKMYHWSTDSITTVVSSNHNEVHPAIGGNIVVWQAEETEYLWYRDYDMGGTTATQVTLAGANASDWAVDNGRIVWLDSSNDSLHVYTPRAPGYDGTLVDYAPAYGNIFGLNIHGDRIVFTRREASVVDDVMQYDIRRRTTEVAAGSATLSEQGGDVFHNTFTWTKPGDGGWDVGYRRPSRLTSTVGGSEEDGSSSLYGHRFAYTRSTVMDDYDVLLAVGNSKLASRTAGANRYTTAVNVSKAYFSAAGNVVLCTGENFPDALSAAPLARALEAPLLLTRKGAIAAETVAEITRLGANKVYVIGSEAAVSKAVYDQVDALPGVTMERIAGANRYDTSAKIAVKLQTIMGSNFVFRAFFARGDNFPDALAVGPVAAGALGPVMLVQTNAVPASIAAAVDSMNITRGYIIGSTAAVSADTATAIRNLLVANGALGTIWNPITARWEGPNRYETAAKVVNEGLSRAWIDLDTLGIATGTNFPDALGGGAALGYYGSPVLLTSGTALSGAASAFLTQHEYEIGRVDVFGSTAAVSAAVYDAVVAKIK